jgi:DNA-binding transcriptional LysR family regulator
MKNIRDLSLREFHVLSVMLNERSLTRTAQLLETTQPSVSKVLGRLRAHFDDPLFVRVGLSMQPTPKALQLLGPLRDLLATSELLHISPLPFDPATSDREFRLLLTDVGMTYFLPPLMSRLEKEGANLRLHAVPLDSRQFEAKLESGEADIALGAFPRASKRLRRQRLYITNYLSVVRKGHPRSTQLSSAAGFFSERHIVVSASNTGHAMHQIVERALEHALPREKIQLRLPSFMAAAAVVRQTDAVATMPSHLAQFVAKELGLVTFRPPLTLPRIEIAQYWHERIDREPGHRWIRAAIFSLFRQGRDIA